MTNDRWQYFDGRELPASTSRLSYVENTKKQAKIYRLPPDQRANKPWRFVVEIRGRQVGFHLVNDPQKEFVLVSSGPPEHCLAMIQDIGLGVSSPGQKLVVPSTKFYNQNEQTMFLSVLKEGLPVLELRSARSSRRAEMALTLECQRKLENGEYIDGRN